MHLYPRRGVTHTAAVTARTIGFFHQHPSGEENMRITRHRYSRALEQAAEDFLIGQFEAPSQFVESGHLPDLIEAAMHIVTGAAWVQPDTSRDRLRDMLPEDGATGFDEDEDEEDE